MVPRLQTAAVLLLLASLIARGDKRQLNKRQLRIIDGDDTYNYPYVVAIVDKIELTFYLRKCTGSLISDMWVLTAANCGIVDNEEYFGVVYGNLSIPPHRSPNYRAVLYAVNNPRYRSDICLAMIDRLDLAPGKVSAVDHKTLIGRAMHFVGVGLNSSNKTLLKLKNKGVRNAVLKDNVRPMQFGEGIVVQCDRRLEKGFKTALICLKPRCVNKGLRVQHGDYGGPLIFKGKIVGIATNLNKDTLYTAVSPHLDWIQSVTESMRGLIFRSPHDNERLEIYKSHRDPKHGAELGTFFRNKINTRPVFRAEESVPDNLSCFTHGCSTGWVSGVLGNEALTGGAWLAALPCLVALPAAPFFAVLADARGRKAGALCVCVSFIISWSLAAWCGPRGVWAARVAAGAGGAGSLALAPLYCAEIAPRTRGLAAMPALACSCGILFAYGAGGVLSAHALSLSMAVPPVVLLVSLLWLPETPSFLISVGRIQDAAKVMCWFDGSDFQEDLTDVIEQQEVRIRTSECYGRRDMRRQDSDTFQPMLKRISGLDSNSDKKTEQSPCRELFRHRRSRRALFSCLVLLCAAAGSGAGAVNSFAAAVLRHSAHAVPHLNVTAYNFTIYNGTAPRAFFDTSEAGSMLCGTALVLGAAVATVTVDKIGRKMLLLWSCSGIACCLAILGVYCDPRLRMHSWYSQRLWPYKRTTMKDESISENLSLTYQDNINDAAMNNLTDGILKLNFPDEEVGSNNLNEGFVLPIPRLSDNNDTLTERDVMMTKYEDESEVTIWAPVVLLSMMLFLYNIGLGSVPYVLITEMFSINVRSLASGLFISWMWLSNFLLLRYYGTIAISLGLHGTYYISASITLLGAVYTYFVIPETKGRSQGQIEEALSRPLCGRKRRKNEETR